MRRKSCTSPLECFPIGVSLPPEEHHPSFNFYLSHFNLIHPSLAQQNPQGLQREPSPSFLSPPIPEIFPFHTINVFLNRGSTALLLFIFSPQCPAKSLLHLEYSTYLLISTPLPHSVHFGFSKPRKRRVEKARRIRSLSGSRVYRTAGYSTGCGACVCEI